MNRPQPFEIALLTRAAKSHKCKKCGHSINKNTFYINYRTPGNHFPIYTKYHKKCFTSLEKPIYIEKSGRYFRINPEPLTNE